MWADAFYHAEQLHLFQILFWAALSILAGTALLVIDARARRTALIGHFARQCIVWGLAELALAAIAYHGLALRDVSSASRAERLAWFALGLYVGIAAVGASLAIATWRLGGGTVDSPRRALSGIGTGVAISVQGLALTVMQLLFVAQISH